MNKVGHAVQKYQRNSDWNKLQEEGQKAKLNKNKYSKKAGKRLHGKENMVHLKS